LRLGFELSLPLEPELAPSGWRWPHRRPYLMGSFGYLVMLSGGALVTVPAHALLYSVILRVKVGAGAG
jgi:hypothetical protein